MSAEQADYLDTQTLAGGDGYFHTENAPTHATDGTAVNPSEETPLVKASRGEADAGSGEPDGGEEKPPPTNAQLIQRLVDAGLPLPGKKPNKAALQKALADAGLSAD